MTMVEEWWFLGLQFSTFHGGTSGVPLPLPFRNPPASSRLPNMDATNYPTTTRGERQARIISHVNPPIEGYPSRTALDGSLLQGTGSRIEQQPLGAKDPKSFWRVAVLESAHPEDGESQCTLKRAPQRPSAIRFGPTFFFLYCFK